MRISLLRRLLNKKKSENRNGWSYFISIEIERSRCEPSFFSLSVIYHKLL